MAGSERAYEAGLDKAGTLRAESVQHLFDTRVLGDQPLPENKMAVITNAGGPGVMTTDAIGESELKMADFTDETFSDSATSLPAEGNIYNPVDIVGDATTPGSRRHSTWRSPTTTSMAVVVACPTAVLSFEELSERIVEQQEQFGKPVAATLMGGKRSTPVRTS